MISTLTANAPTFTPFLGPPGYTKISQDRRLQAGRSFVTVPCTRSKLFKGVQTISHPRQQQYKAGMRSASLNARCAAEQTQTVTRQSSKITISPFQGKQTLKLDDGGTGFPPKDRGGGGGGGGGGGPDSSGGFFLFGFLLFLSFLRDLEEDESRRGRGYN